MIRFAIKLPIKLQKLKKKSQQKNSEAVANENNKKNLKGDIYLLKKDKRYW